MSAQDEKSPLSSEVSGFDNAIMGAMAKASLDALITIDGDGLILEFGPAAERIFGYARSEVLGRPIHEIVIPPRLRGAHQDGMRRYHESGKGPVLNTRVEVPAIRRDGTEFDAELTVVPIRIGDRELFTAFVRDISERKAMELARQQALEAAQQSDAAKSRFLAHMSHELRTPLTGVLGAAELLNDAPEAQRSRLLSLIRDNGRSLLRTVDQVLEYSRVTSGGAQLRQEPLSLAALLQAVLDGVRQGSAARPVRFSVDCDESLPRQLMGDSRHLRQVLDILADNAVKFTAEGKIVLRASKLRDEGSRVRVRLEVEDSGIGVDEQTRLNLFEPFRQADDSDRTAYGGAGLGLAIARVLVESMGGTIGCDSVIGRGSTFWIELNMDPAPDEVRSPVPRKAAVPAPDAVDADADSPLDLNVLLVEDTPSNQLILSALLKRMGCATAIAENGDQAVQRLTEWDYDVVLMDLRLPIVDGLEATRRIRALASAGRNVPIIGLTANAFPEDERRCRDAGMDDYLTKPVRYSELRRHLMTVTTAHAGQRRP